MADDSSLSSHRLSAAGALRTLIIAAVAFALMWWVDYPAARYVQSDLPAAVRQFFAWTDLLGTNRFWVVVNGALFVIAGVVYRSGRPRPAKPAAFAAPLSLLASLLAAGAAVRLVKITVGRARPKQVFGGEDYCCTLFSFGDESASFPSGHSASAWAGLAWFMLRFPKFRAPLVILATLGALSRVALLRHYVSDVFAGAVIGVFTTILVCEHLEARRRKVSAAPAAPSPV